MPPLVGAEGVSLGVFLAFDTFGCFLWSGFYAGLGYVFSNQLEVAIAWVRHFGAAFLVGILALICIYAGWRGLILMRMIRRLRLRRIGPAMLARRLKSNNKVAVLDLLDFEAQSNTDQRESIPGAFRVDPVRLRKSPHLTVPDDVDMVLYSSSGGDTLPARVALGLQRIGICNVWVLEGGLTAWSKQGFPVAHSLEQVEVVAARVGVKLPTED